MDPILDEEELPNTFTDEELFTQIWTRPKAVLAYIHEYKYDKYVTILLVLAGIKGSFDRASMKGMGDSMSMIGILGVCIIFGALFGWITYYICAAIISFTGKWLEGRGNTQSLLRVISYSLIPTVISLVLLIPQIGIYGIEMFKSDGDILSQGIIPNIVFYASIALEFVLSICSIVFAVIGIAVVQNFGYGKAFLNIMLPIIIIAIPLLILFLVTDIFS